MTTETQRAFGHPEERSKASAADPFLDRISLRDHIVSVEIGAFQAERGSAQRLSFNIVVEVRHASADLGDDVDLILSYDRVTEAIDLELGAERLNLLETLAERIADRILREPQAQRVFVRIEKLDRGAGALGVEIVRSFDELHSASESMGDEAPKPQIVFLNNAALVSPYLKGWVEQLCAKGQPLVFCVSALDGASPSAATPHAQNHIDLLSIEQNAWLVSGLVQGSAVVATRTELDWAIKNDQVSIWAPSKFVFDAVDGPMDMIGDPLALAGWLAGQINASDFLLIGEDLPENAQVSCRAHALTQERI